MKRILALDILRGITIAGMILVNTPGSWEHIYAPLRHAEWNGLTPTDLVFPFFMFIMGISTYISLRKYDFEFSRAAVLKIVRRSLVIFLIGLALNWLTCSTVAELRILGVMQRLALCYGATAIVALTLPHRLIPSLIVTLLGGYFLLLFCGNGFAYNETNILSVVDRAILTPAHMYPDHGIDPEGILSTLPAIAHAMVGFWVGSVIVAPLNPPKGTAPLNPPKGGTQEVSSQKLEVRSNLLTTNSYLLTSKSPPFGGNEGGIEGALCRLFIIGTILTFAGFLLGYGCPLNKKIWSPTFVLATCGLASSTLALLIWIIDVKGEKRWCRLFESFGVNPLFMYVLADVLAVLFDSILFPWGNDSINLNGFLYEVVLAPLLGETGGSLAYALLFVLMCGCIGYQLYKRKIYIKI